MLRFRSLIRYASTLAKQEEKAVIKVLESELKAEKPVTELSPSMTKYLNQSGFKYVSVPRNPVVKLVKESENETVTISYDISQTYEQPANEDGLEDEEDDPELKNLEESEIDLDVSVEISKKINDRVDSIIAEVSLNQEYTAIHNVQFVHNGQKDLYQGPAFETLDQELQDGLEDYLQSKGLNEGLTTFIQDSINNKESKEYQLWLEDMKSFIKQ